MSDSFILNVQISDDELQAQLCQWVADCAHMKISTQVDMGAEPCQLYLWDYATFIYHTQLNTGLPKALIIFNHAQDDEMEQAVLLSGALDFILSTNCMANILLRLSHHVQRLRYLARLESLSVTDTLTGLFNRRKYDLELDKCWRQGQRLNSPCSLLLLDVDHFKKFNDSYGHMAGDQCLTTLAEVFQQEAVRPLDIAARIGGEEFAVILPHTPHDGALHVANRIIERVSGLHIPHKGVALGVVSISIGLVSICPSQEDNIIDWQQSADDVLYLAKDRGRNQVVCGELKSQRTEQALLESGLVELV